VKLILVELNEINFDAVRHYLDKGEKLPGLKVIIESGLLSTVAEQEYEHLEPWIQWPSVHTGKKYNEHKVFRLGDFVSSEHVQFFEKVEDAGYRVGAISPMNATNNLKTPAYFIPDPWTQTPTDGSFLSRSVSSAVSQAVNDNSQSKLTFITVVNLGLSFFALVSPLRFISMLRYAVSAFGKPWRKALFLDLLLHEIHKTLFRRKKPQFSTLFLNAGAHIQHHYFYNSSFVTSAALENPSWYIDEKEDPFFEMLKVYDYVVQDLLAMSDVEIIIATGLSQRPYDQLKFYYRLKDHERFLRDLDIRFLNVVPRMTRDFLITFESEDQAIAAAEKLDKIFVCNRIKLFEEIDNRGKDLFVVLTYPNEILDSTTITYGGRCTKLLQYVTFVAIKNGEHQGKGFAYFSEGIKLMAPPEASHVAMIHNTVLKYFNVPHEK